MGFPESTDLCSEVPSWVPFYRFFFGWEGSVVNRLQKNGFPQPGALSLLFFGGVGGFY